MQPSPSNSLPAQAPSGANAGLAVPPEFSDSLLKSFSDAQKSYIVKNLYPEIGKALVHFISEAKRHNQISEDEPFGTNQTGSFAQAPQV